VSNNLQIQIQEIEIVPAFFVICSDKWSLLSISFVTEFSFRKAHISPVPGSVLQF